jgi:hypothetical protein
MDQPQNAPQNMIFSPMEDITAYELAKLLSLLFSGKMDFHAQERIKSLPDNALRHIAVNGTPILKVDPSLTSYKEWKGRDPFEELLKSEYKKKEEARPLSIFSKIINFFKFS